MSARPRQQVKRPDGALLAGVCAWIARVLRWNVWVLRALFVGLLAIKTVAAPSIYAILAVTMHLSGIWQPNRKKAGDRLTSPELSQRSQRIADLERQFRALDKKP